MRAKSYVEDLMYGRRQSLILSPGLSFLSLLYRAASGMRRELYRNGILKSKKLPCKVISIGNLTVGGTGKTPMVIAVAALLLENRKHPLVVSRGYGRQDESDTLLVSDGRSVLVDSHAGGDEPVLIGSRLPGVPVVVGRERYEAAQFALQRFNPDTVILDDGFQHLRLKRDLDIVLVDALDPFGNGKLFPAGILREPVTALERAQAVVITRAEAPGTVEELTKSIKSITRARIFTSTQRPLDLVDAGSGECKPLPFLRGKRILAMSGIARPASFRSLLTSLGANVAAECIYPDHYRFQKTDIADIIKKSADQGAEMIVTTEKDAVRLRGLKHNGIWALRIEFFVNEQKEWQTFLLNQL